MPLLVDFLSSFTNSRSRAFRKSIVHKKKSARIYTRMHSAGLKLTKLTYTRLEDNLIRHRGDRSAVYSALALSTSKYVLYVTLRVHGISYQLATTRYLRLPPTRNIFNAQAI